MVLKAFIACIRNMATIGLKFYVALNLPVSCLS